VNIRRSQAGGGAGRHYFGRIHFHCSSRQFAGVRQRREVAYRTATRVPSPTAQGPLHNREEHSTPARPDVLKSTQKRGVHDLPLTGVTIRYDHGRLQLPRWRYRRTRQRCYSKNTPSSDVTCVPEKYNSSHRSRRIPTTMCRVLREEKSNDSFRSTTARNSPNMS
jgi:hypothetical protein